MAAQGGNLGLLLGSHWLIFGISATVFYVVLGTRPHRSPAVRGIFTDPPTL